MGVDNAIQPMTDAGFDKVGERAVMPAKIAEELDEAS